MCVIIRKPENPNNPGGRDQCRDREVLSWDTSRSSQKKKKSPILLLGAFFLYRK